MTQKNEAPVLILSLVVTAMLLGGGGYYLYAKTRPAAGPAPTPQPDPTTSPEPTPASSSPSPEPTPEPANNAPPPPTIAQVPNVPSGTFNYGGSTTWAPMRAAVDPTIQANHPNFTLRYTDPIVGTPGSGAGIRMLLENQLDFSQSSRPIEDEEYERARTRGFELREETIAIDGIAVAVNHDLEIEGITVEQLRDIYLGNITNWSQVGGPDLPITPISRDPDDGGTVSFFVENVLGGQDFGSNVEIVYSTTPGLRAVADNPGGIYYASAPELVPQCSIKPIPLGRTSDRLVPPYQNPRVPPSECPQKRNQLNKQAFSSGEYPITRRLFVIIKQDGGDDQAAGEAYAQLLLTDEGQNLLSETGFVPIR